MRRVFFAYLNGAISFVEFERYLYLHSRLMGDAPFVEIEDTEEWREFMALGTKIYSAPDGKITKEKITEFINKLKIENERNTQK